MKTTLCSLAFPSLGRHVDIKDKLHFSGVTNVSHVSWYLSVTKTLYVYRTYPVALIISSLFLLLSSGKILIIWPNTTTLLRTPEQKWSSNSLSVQNSMFQSSIYSLDWTGCSSCYVGQRVHTGPATMHWAYVNKHMMLNANWWLKFCGLEWES